MDFLPALPDGNSFGLILESRNLRADNKETTLAITDKTSEFYDQLTLNWEVSNPLGYFEWFKGRMKERYNIRKNAIAESYKIDIEDVPDYKIKTSLQKAIQILKRHRDIYFKDNLEKRVSSVIISTLAAHAYNGNSSLTETLLELTKNMKTYIIKTGNEYQITNPVNPVENFADKWNNNDDLAIAFRNWIKLAHQDIIDIINGEDNIFENIEIKDKYIEKFGKKSFNNAFGKSLKKYEEKFGKKSGIIAGTTAISRVSKPYGGDCHN
ncbi:MAG: hypothetical protein WBG30_03315 [Psychrilyobacter sp.]|uniref:hypothetical protein n=1 Tax=Psychrilyobacter sp. TaxID=2586924 RepID=UPI003C72AF0A